MRRRGLGDLPLDLRTGHDRLMPGWEDGGRAFDPRRQTRTGNFSPAIPFTTVTQSKLALPLNVRRIYLLVSNTHASNNIWVNLSQIAVVNSSIKVPPGGVWEPWAVPINEIHIIGDAVGTTCVLVEGSS